MLVTLATDKSATPAEVRLTFVIPTYNCSKYLRDAVDSILIQADAHSSIEIIIVDDGSTDDTLVVANKILALDDKVKLVHLEKNAGLGAARNIGITHSSGEFLFFLDADDILAPDALAELLKFSSHEKSESVVLFDQVPFGPDLHTVENKKNFYRRKCASIRMPGPIMLRDLQRIGGAYAQVSGYLSKRDIWQRIKFPDGMFEDEVPFVQILLEAPVVSVNPVDIALHRIRANSLTTSRPTARNRLGRQANVQRMIGVFKSYKSRSFKSTQLCAARQAVIRSIDPLVSVRMTLGDSKPLIWISIMRFAMSSRDPAIIARCIQFALPKSLQFAISAMSRRRGDS